MPRTRRIIEPGRPLHVISRFAHHEFLLAGPEERADYLQRMARALAKTDWKLFSYALMSSHTHHGVVPGVVPFKVFAQSLHSGFVNWFNSRTPGRVGQGIANRPKTEHLDLAACGKMIAYHHNNPVNAKLVDRAQDSNWTSHRYYLHGNAPPWLHVDLGLELAGFDATPQGLRAFDDFVDTSAGEIWNASDAELLGLRRDARQQLGGAVELATATIGGELRAPLVAPEDALLRYRWRGSLRTLAKAVCRESKLSFERFVMNRSSPDVARARRLFVVAAHRWARRSLTEAGACMGVSQQSASRHYGRANRAETILARKIAQAVGIKVDLVCEVGCVP